MFKALWEPNEWPLLKSLLCSGNSLLRAIRQRNESFLHNFIFIEYVSFQFFCWHVTFVLFLFLFFHKVINKSLQPELNHITWLWEKHMANRLSLQSATCSAFQLQLCRQPQNSNGRGCLFLPATLTTVERCKACHNPKTLAYTQARPPSYSVFEKEKVTVGEDCLFCKLFGWFWVLTLWTEDLCKS